MRAPMILALLGVFCLPAFSWADTPAMLVGHHRSGHHHAGHHHSGHVAYGYVDSCACGHMHAPVVAAPVCGTCDVCDPCASGLGYGCGCSSGLCSNHAEFYARLYAEFYAKNAWYVKYKQQETAARRARLLGQDEPTPAL